MTKGERNKARAIRLQRKYPEMEGIPNAISKGEQKALVFVYEKQKSANQKAALVPYQDIDNIQVSHRPEPPSQQPSQQNGPSRPVSNKMAPLSEERRAEVARNLSGHTSDDPITLD